MTTNKSNQKEVTITLSSIEMHFLNAALMDYSRRAYGITENVHHSDGVEKLSEEVLDAYCGMVELQPTE